MSEQTAIQTPSAQAGEVEPKDIYQAQLAIMEKVPYLLKRKPDPKSRLGYTYAAEADLIAVVRPWFLKFGVVMKPSKVRVVQQEQYSASSGTPWNRVRIRQVFVFRHVASGTTDEVELFGEGCDPGDKTSGKAHTFALKYAIRQWLMLETGDDPDKVASEEQAQAPSSKARDSFAACKEALGKAPSIDTLNVYRKAYQKRGYKPEQIEELERLYLDRARLLKKQQNNQQSQ